MDTRALKRERARQRRIYNAVFWVTVDLACVGAVYVITLLVEVAFKLLGVA